MPEEDDMGCMCKKVLKILAGLGLIAVGMGMYSNPWLIVGLYLFLRGIMPFMCKCECCGGACETKKKK